MNKDKPPSVRRIFTEWCLWNEAPKWPPAFLRLSVMLPVLAAGILAAVHWPYYRKIGSGATGFTELMVIAMFTTVVGGVQFASKAICWEISAEMRELVRLTSIDLKSMLWSRTLSRWLTVAWSIGLIFPLVQLAATFGGVGPAHFTAAAYGLARLWAQLLGFGMLASILTANSKNSEKSTAGLTMFTLIAYNAMFTVIPQAIASATWLIYGYADPSIIWLCAKISDCTPTRNVWTTLNEPDLFRPTDPIYWGHFVPAIACALLATALVDSRFRTVESVDAGHWYWPSWLWRRKRVVDFDRNESDASVVRPIVSRRKRDRLGALECPFFWKDFYVLYDERRGTSLWTLLYLVATAAVVLVNIIDDPFHASPIIAAFLSIFSVAVILSIRFDALVTAEFRDRTWGSLMLLPVDPCHLLWIKFKAAMWEQRYSLLPTVAAQLGLFRQRHFEVVVAAGMCMAMAPLACGLLCQMSCINQLLGKAWWVGPCQIIGFSVIVVLAVSIWVTCGLWPGFVFSWIFLGGVMWTLHFYCVEPLAREWVET